MTSPHWAEVRFLVPPLSKWSAISSDMKVFKSTSWSPFLLRLALEPLLTWVGEPGVLERTLILAIAPLRPGEREKKGFSQTAQQLHFPHVHNGWHSAQFHCQLKGTSSSSLSHPSPKHTFSAFSPCNNAVITGTAFDDVQNELIQQVGTAHSSKH